jgi:2-polyprenyl-3-methyl-5-hydroxy-6-metoxy-1,4-benzoquinol methylase
MLASGAVSRHFVAPDAGVEVPRSIGAGGSGPRIERLSTSGESGFPGEWYDLNSADHFWFEWRMEAALRQWRARGVPLERPLRVLDVGGGRGVLRDQVEAATAWTVDLVELNLAALQSASPGRGRHLYYDVLDRSPDQQGRYDAAILFDVIEHVEEPRPLLDAVAQHLTAEGWLLLNVPALQSLFSAFDVASGHFRRYDRRSLAAEMAGGGWEIRDLRYWGMSLVPMIGTRKLLLRSPSDETIRRGFGPPHGFVRRGLRALMKVETAVLPRAPLGSSLLMVAQRRDGA